MLSKEDTSGQTGDSNRVAERMNDFVLLCSYKHLEKLSRKMLQNIGSYLKVKHLDEENMDSCFQNTCITARSKHFAHYPLATFKVKSNNGMVYQFKVQSEAKMERGQNISVSQVLPDSTVVPLVSPSMPFARTANLISRDYWIIKIGWKLGDSHLFVIDIKKSEVIHNNISNDKINAIEEIFHYENGELTCTTMIRTMREMLMGKGGTLCLTVLDLKSMAYKLEKQIPADSDCIFLNDHLYWTDVRSSSDNSSVVLVKYNRKTGEESDCTLEVLEQLPEKAVKRLAVVQNYVVALSYSRWPWCTTRLETNSS